MTKRKLTKIKLRKRTPSRWNPGVVRWSFHNELDQYRGVIQLETLEHSVCVSIHTLGFIDTRVVLPEGIRETINSILEARGYYIDWKEAPNAVPTH